jgi:hypothetical protein
MSIEQIIKYVVKRLNEKKVTATRLRVVKLLYLIEVEYYAKHFKRLTDIDWICWNYGPYWMSFPEDMKSVREIEEEKIQADREFYSYKIPPETEVPNPLSGIDRLLVDHPIEEWATADMRDLLNHVYFRTPPMINATRGARLDFLSIRAVLDAKANRQVKIDPERLRRLKTELGRLHRRIAEREPRRLDSNVHEVHNKTICGEDFVKSIEDLAGE